MQNYRGLIRVGDNPTLVPYQTTHPRNAELRKAGQPLIAGTAVKQGSITTKRHRISLAIIQAGEDYRNPGIVLPVDTSTIEIQMLSDCQILKGGGYCIPDYCYHYSEEIIKPYALIRVGAMGKWAYTNNSFLAVGETLEYNPSTKQLIISLN